MIATDAGRAVSSPPPPPPPGPSFLRRHPLLAGFGVLAALSLFAAYWPASAIVTGVLVAARASGADRAALSLLQQGGRRILQRLRDWGGRAPEAAAPEPAAPAPDPPAAHEPPVAAPEPSPVAAGPSPAPAGPPPPRPRRPRPAPRARERSAPPAGVEIER
ncbi:MAG: hypothetical protein JOZ75_01110 [Candidatus Dormibacteraeota bacterium]|nr:hypothetical protein [Candidatus Dormibacteraeota bacterium]